MLFRSEISTFENLTDEKETNKTNAPNINIEDLIKKLDAKINELEEEDSKLDKKEKKPKKIEQLNISEDDSYDKLEETVYEKFDDFFKIEPPKEDNNSTVNIDSDSKIVDTPNVTDDQFYDDFY